MIDSRWQLAVIDSCAVRTSQIVQVGSLFFRFELEDGMLAADGGIFEDDVADVWVLSNEYERFLDERQFLDD